MKQTGEILKEAREKKGLSLSEVGAALKLTNKVLKAIEEGDEKNLPPKMFVRGFIKSYATFLHLDPVQVLDVYYSETSTVKEHNFKSGSQSTSNEQNRPGSKKTMATNKENALEQALPTKQDSFNPLEQNKNTKTYGLIAIGLVLVGLILFTKKMIEKYSKEVVPPQSQLSENKEGSHPIENNPPTEIKQVPPVIKTDVLTTPEPKKVVESIPQSANTQMNILKSQDIKTESTKNPLPSTEVKKTTEEVSSAEEKTKSVELIVEALDEVEIEYSALNGKPQKIKLSADQVHTFKSKSGLKIHFSNGGAVNLIKNGTEIGIPGDIGKPVSLSY